MLDNTLRLLSPGCEIVKLKKVTKGGLCSTLMAVDKINKEDSLLILNGDQIMDSKLASPMFVGQDWTRIREYQHAQLPLTILQKTSGWC